jgi:hypothetical protein
MRKSLLRQPVTVVYDWSFFSASDARSVIYSALEARLPSLSLIHGYASKLRLKEKL